eukprot:2704701-Pleurochrysis_carterae.AAC.1
MAARRSVDGASDVMSGRERRRLSPACSRRCMYSAPARPGGMAWMCEVAFAARTVMDLGCAAVLVVARCETTCACNS